MADGGGGRVRVGGPRVQLGIEPARLGYGGRIRGQRRRLRGWRRHGGQGGTCPPSQATDLPDGINLNNDCPYVGANTAGCGAGTFEYNCPDPLGFAIAPAGGMRPSHVGRRHDAALVLHDRALQPLHQPRRALRLPVREPLRLQLRAGRDRVRDLHREHERRLLLPVQLTHLV